MRTLLLTCVLAGALVAGDGVRPRPEASDYPGHESANGVTIAAQALSPDQVKHLFATDLSRYIVVELAIYPEGGQQLELTAIDFALKIGASGDQTRAASPRSIASINQRKNEPKPGSPGDVAIYPTATIGYESGTVYDPVTGQRRGGGVYGGGGVDVAVGEPRPPRPAGTDRDRGTMRQELEDRSLPEGKINRAVAGYLYFPRPAGKLRNALYEISYYGPTGKVQVSVPPPQAK